MTVGDILKNMTLSKIAVVIDPRQSGKAVLWIRKNIFRNNLA